MNISWYVSLMVASVIVGYLMGFTPLGLSLIVSSSGSVGNISSTINLSNVSTRPMYGSVGSSEPLSSMFIKAILDAIIAFATDWKAVLAGFLLIIGALMFGGELLNKLFLIGIIFVVANLFVLPTSYLVLDYIPVELKFIITLFYNSILFLFVVEMLRW
ncbi:MAG: hypothetical protein QW103_02220 [Candidatus Pacearchaeota archaeon]